MLHMLALGTTVLASLATTSALGITFDGFPASGTYEDVTSLNADGTCTFATKNYGAGPAPFDQELSAIIRGPVTLKKFAVYNLDGSSAKRSEHARRHAHQAFHEHKKEAREAMEEKRANGDVLVATMPDGTLMTMTQNWDKPGPTPIVGAGSKAVAGSGAGGPVPATSVVVHAGAGNWGQVANYDSATGNASGLAFLANNNWAN